MDRLQRGPPFLCVPSPAPDSQKSRESHSVGGIGIILWAVIQWRNDELYYVNLGCIFCEMDQEV
jgi:hypothetical protein